MIRPRTFGDSGKSVVSFSLSVNLKAQESGEPTLNPIPRAREDVIRYPKSSKESGSKKGHYIISYVSFISLSASLGIF